MRQLPVVLAVALVLLPVPASPAAPAAPAHEHRQARVLRVGPDRALTTPSAAAAIARDGDTVRIDAGDYVGDVATWTQDDLTLVGVGGWAHLEADGQSAQGKAIWVVAGDRARIQNIEFSGAVVPDENGAGIRAEGTDLTVVHCWFHHNQDGILAGANAESDIEIRRSRFTDLLPGTGFTHDIYIGTVRSFYLKGSFVTGASQGHQVKSRALRTTVTANRIADLDSNASYSIDLPNGGDVKIAGNVIEQGPSSPNSTVVAYGAEGLVNPTTRLWLVNNTLVNHRDSGTFLMLDPASSDVHVWNNLLVGPGDLVAGAAAQRRANLRVGTGGFVDAAGFDFHLRKRSRAVDAGAAAPRQARPRYEYVHPLRFADRPTRGRVDVGAYEWTP
ncbi:MAG: hypothetical protein U0R80_05000 [Nocardioidaceae bacterium]